MMNLHALRLDPSFRPKEYSRLINAVSPERRDRVVRFRRREDALRCLFGGLLVRHVMIQATGVRNRDLSYSRDEGGKPVCLLPAAPHFNLSHSGRWILAAFDDLPVGADVERIKPVDPGVPALVLSPLELETMESLPENGRRPFFYEIWVLKESRMKASGSGLTDSLTAYSVAETGKPGRFLINNDANPDGSFLFLLPGFDPDYRAAVCSSRDESPPAVIYEDPEKLAEFFLRDQS